MPLHEKVWSSAFLLLFPASVRPVVGWRAASQANVKEADMRMCFWRSISRTARTALCPPSLLRFWGEIVQANNGRCSECGLCPSFAQAKR